MPAVRNAASDAVSRQKTKAAPAQQVAMLLQLCVGEGHTREAVRLARLTGARGLGGADQPRAGAVEEEVAGGQRRRLLRRRTGDRQGREPRREQPLDLGAQPLRPERDPVLGPVPLEQGEHARGVRDVTDVHRLPGGAEQDAPGRGRGPHRGARQGAGHGRREEPATIHHHTSRSACGRGVSMQPRGAAAPAAKARILQGLPGRRGSLSICGARRVNMARRSTA